MIHRRTNNPISMPEHERGGLNNDRGCSTVLHRCNGIVYFGGVKNSGFGRELSELGIGEFLNRKLVRIAGAV